MSTTSNKYEFEIKVGLFVMLGIGLILLAVLILGNSENLLVAKSNYFAKFESVDGLIPGAKVVSGGIQIGTISDIDFDMNTRRIQVSMQVAKRYSPMLRTDSTAEILTQGVLGDKFINISVGSPTLAEAQPGTVFSDRPSQDLSQFLSKGDRLLLSLNSIATSVERLLKSFEQTGRSDAIFQGLATTSKNLAQASEKLNNELDQLKLKQTIQDLNKILQKINNGTGTLGALVNDPSLYDDARALLGGANRNRVLRNIVRQAVKDGEQKVDQPGDK